MSGTVFYLAGGLLLTAFLILLLLRVSASSAEAAANEEPACPALPQPEVTDRLFGSADWNYVAAQHSERLKRLFIEQRTSLALSWIGEVRSSTSRVMVLHRMSARTNAQLDPLVELRLAGNYFFFQIFCWLLTLVIYVHGPVGMLQVVRALDGLSERLRVSVTGLLPAEQRRQNKTTLS